MSDDRVRRTLEVQGWPYWLFERLIFCFGVYFVVMVLPELVLGRSVTLTSAWPAVGFAVALTLGVALFAYQDRKEDAGKLQPPRGE
jgi:hypothetical protein